MTGPAPSTDSGRTRPRPIAVLRQSVRTSAGRLKSTNAQGVAVEIPSPTTHWFDVLGARLSYEVQGSGPAQVFGSSGGAVTGLALVAGHPEQIVTLIAHEPPLALLLPDAEEARAGMQEIYDTYRREGIGAAWQRFSAFAGINIGSPDENAPPGPADPAGWQRATASLLTGSFPLPSTNLTSLP
jgi:pimeloyl-ACP methyl ester carboxylesterase